jgi:large subunit ribosomal protein L25
MANVVTIEAEVRARSGKGAARATRRAGKVPGVIYGGKQEPNLIALDPRVVLRELHRAGWQSRLYEINAGAEPVRALIRGVQFHPVSDAPEHVDFQRLVAGQRIKVAVPVHFENDGISPGIKRGAVLNVVRHAVEVYCDADNIPEQFTADLGSLDFNDNVRWHDLKGTENVKAVIDRDFVVATVVPPTKIEVVAEAGAVAGAPTAAAPAKGGTRAPGKAPAKKG